MAIVPQITILAAMSAAFLVPALPAAAGGEVNVYSYRQPDLVRPVLEAFTKKTGITANLLYLDRGPIERMRIEGENSPADVVLTVDVARLDELKRAGLTQRLDDAPLDKEIPAKLRDAEGHWFGLSMDARVAYASKARVKENSITYEELADPKWKGKVCLRDGQHSSNLALFASMIAVHGQHYTETWLTGLRNNLARRPNGSDRTQAKAIMEGRCDIGIGNTYFIAAMLADDHSPDEKAWADAVRVIYPNTGDRGTHVNISGIALARHAPNRDNAVKLMEFLASRDAQEIYSRTTLEYPVAPGAAPADVLAAFGPLKPDAVALSEIARYREQAADLVETSEFNDGPAE